MQLFLASGAEFKFDQPNQYELRTLVFEIPRNSRLTDMRLSLFAEPPILKPEESSPAKPTESAAPMSTTAKPAATKSAS
jgi:hypothetical protein